MTTDRFEKQVHAGWTMPDHEPAGKREKIAAEVAECGPERQAHIARCAFEIIGVTVQSGAFMDSDDMLDSGEVEQDRMMSSLVSALEPGQTVSFVYEGGGHTPLRWLIVAAARSLDSAVHAKDSLQNVRHAVRAVLESRKAFYRFKPVSTGDTDWTGSSRTKWLGTIQPQGTRVKHIRGKVGFKTPSEQPEDRDTAVFLPHYMQDRAKAFTSPINLLVSSPMPLRISIRLESCRLDRAQKQSVKSALDAVLERGADNELPAHLENAANLWLKALAGCRVTCTVASPRPIASSFLKMLGGELYHCPVEVSCRREGEGASVARGSLPQQSPHVLDLRECIPSMAPLPPLFPQPEVLARCGMKRFFNRESPALSKGGILLGSIRDGNAEKTVRLCSRERSRHLYILGATGTGKSTLLFNLVMQDIQRGEGVCLIDPHGDLYHQVLKSIPAHRANDVVLLDTSDRNQAVGINLLECTGPYREMQSNFVINETFAILSRLYDMDVCGGPMFELYFRSALQLIMADPDVTGTLVDMSAVFEHKAYRHALIKKCEPSLVSDFWKMAEKVDGEWRLANIAPYIVCKLNQFVHNAMIRPIIGQAKSTIDFRGIMDSQRILLVNLSRGALGENDMKLLGMIVLTKLICAAMSRLDTATNRRKPFRVYVDEFQNFTTGATEPLLSESRKFGLCLTLANQNLAQLAAGKGRENLVHSVLGNVGSMVFFRLGAPDAERLAIYTKPQFGPEDLQTLPNFHAASRLLAPTGPSAPFVFQTFPAIRRRNEPAVMRRIESARQSYSTKIMAIEENIRKRREDIRNMGVEGKDKKAEAELTKIFGDAGDQSTATKKEAT